MQGHANPVQARAVGTERAGFRRRRHGVEDVLAEELGGGQHARELREGVEVLILQRLQRLGEGVERGADIDDDVLPVQRLPKDCLLYTSRCV